MIWKRNSTLKKGDMVYHVLYGKSWRAIVLEVSREVDAITKKQKTLIHIIPGTRYDNYFSRESKKDRRGRYSGWVSNHWLVKIN